MNRLLSIFLLFLCAHPEFVGEASAQGARAVLSGYGVPAPGCTGPACGGLLTVTRTGHNASLVVLTSGGTHALATGDVLLATTPSGDIAGQAVWTGEPLGIALWEQVDLSGPGGFEGDDPIALKRYRAGETVPLSGTWTTWSGVAASPLYARDGVLVLTATEEVEE